MPPKAKNSLEDLKTSLGYTTDLIFPSSPDPIASLWKLIADGGGVWNLQGSQISFNYTPVAQATAGEVQNPGLQIVRGRRVSQAQETFEMARKEPVHTNVEVLDGVVAHVRGELDLAPVVRHRSTKPSPDC